MINSRPEGLIVGPIWSPQEETTVKTLVLYDSKFGNTERLAQAIAGRLGEAGSVDLKAAKDAPAETAGYDLIVAGAPTQGHTMSAPMRTALRGFGRDSLRSKAVAAFDTRFHGVRLFTGSAAVAIAGKTKRSGARLIVDPESFFVEKSEGPLAEGELERASAWAGTILKSMSTLDAVASERQETEPQPVA